MTSLYITEQGARVERLSRRIVVRRSSETLLEVPVKDIERVVVFGAVQVTTQALSLLLENGVDINLLTIHGRFKGKVCSGLSKNLELRLAQYARLNDPEFCRLFVFNIVEAKIRSEQAILKRYVRNHRDSSFNDELATIGRALRLLPQQDNLGSIRALEGIASAAYFRAFAKMGRSEFSFANRNKRPPLDPINGLLSLGYVLVCGELAGVLEAHGLDPFMGFYHVGKRGRPSLALDILEEFRHVVVDRFTLRMLNTSALSADDFETRKSKQVYLKQESFRRYVHLYEEYLTRRFLVRGLGKRVSFRELFRIEAERLVQAVSNRAEYEPLIVK